MKRILRRQSLGKAHPTKHFAQRIVPAFKHLEKKSQPIVRYRAYNPAIPTVSIMIFSLQPWVSIRKDKFRPRPVPRLRKLLVRQCPHGLLFNLKDHHDRHSSALTHCPKRRAPRHVIRVRQVKALSKVLVRATFRQNRVFKRLVASMIKDHAITPPCRQQTSVISSTAA